MRSNIAYQPTMFSDSFCRKQFYLPLFQGTALEDVCYPNDEGKAGYFQMSFSFWRDWSNLTLGLSWGSQVRCQSRKFIAVSVKTSVSSLIKTLGFLIEKIFDFKVDSCPKLYFPIPQHGKYNVVTFHRMWPRKYGWLNFAILECSLNVSIVNKTVFTAPELREKCAAKSEVFPSRPKIPETSQKQFLAEISNVNIFHITQYFWVKSYKRNQWNLPNISAYISGIFDFFQGESGVAYPGILKGTGHCAEGRILIGGRWAPQISN